jgi:hypothetical protein
MIQAEGADLAVMWGGTAEARVKADEWVEKRVAALFGGPTASLLEGQVPPPQANNGSPPRKKGGDSSAKAGRGQRDAVFIVDGDNASAGQIFMGMASQWRVTTMSNMAGGIRIKEGLDYTALPVVATALGLTLDKDCFEGVQALERLTLGLEAIAAKKRGRT